MPKVRSIIRRFIIHVAYYAKGHTLILYVIVSRVVLELLTIVWLNFWVWFPCREQKGLNADDPDPRGPKKKRRKNEKLNKLTKIDFTEQSSRSEFRVSTVRAERIRLHRDSMFFSKALSPSL